MLQVGIFVGVLVILGLVWAANGYDDTWLYVTAGIIAAPSAWFMFGPRK